MRICLDADEPLVLERELVVGDRVPLGGGGEVGNAAGAGVGTGGSRVDKESLLTTRSGESRTAESTRISAVRCMIRVTSDGFHCSSSTNFAD